MFVATNGAGNGSASAGAETDEQRLDEVLVAALPASETGLV
jgi:hypothetical protein